MRARFTITLVVVCFARLLYAQSDQTEMLKSWYEHKKYDEIESYKPKANEELTAEGMYYTAMAYYMQEKDEDAMKYFDMALKKGPPSADMYYYKGMLLYYRKDYDKALDLFNKAITLLPYEPDYYGSKTDAYIKLEKSDSAMVNVKKATALENCKPRYFLLYAALLAEQKKYVESVDAYKYALSKINSVEDSDEYSTCLYNLGLSQQLMGDSAGSRATFEKYVAAYPSDYHAIAKLIQAYYSAGEFDKAKPYKKMLYDAYNDKKLPEEMSKMFCFNQFKWKGKTIMAFESFDEPKDVYSYVKHNFYVVNDEGDVEYRIQSESDAMLHESHPDKLYVLCLVKGGSYRTYWSFTFNDDVNYTDLKKAVLNILNGDVKPEAGTDVGK